MGNAGHRTVSLHLGAHKTATTYIQKVLRASKSALTAQGIKYVPMQKVRKNITHRLRAHQHRVRGRERTVADIRDYIDSRFPDDAHRLVISEENLVGNCRQLYTEAALYPRLENRLQLVAEALQGYEVHAWFCVRDYTDFLPSAYCEFLRHNDFVTFTDFISRVDANTPHWTGVVEGIRAVFGPARTRIWAYEDFRAHASTVMAALLGRDAVPLQYEIDDARQSMSAASIRELERLAGELDPAAVRAQVKAVTQAFPKGDDYPGFDPWENAQREFWQDKYRRELQGLRQQEGLFLDLW